VNATSRHGKRGHLERPDCRIYYEVTGSGPALVFAHGLGGNHLSWWQQVAYFAPRFTCVTFAHRGFLPSTNPPGGPDPRDYRNDLGALIDHLGLSDVRLVAQSMGGWTCLEYALARPDKVEALVLASTTGTFAPSSPPPPRAAGPDDGVHPAAGRRMAEEQPALHFLYREIDDLNRALDKASLREKLFRSRTRRAAELAALKVPTLVMIGEEDIVIPPPAMRELAAAIPGAKVIAVPDAGHSIYFERPELFNSEVNRFISKLQ
jgi:pimeloyl-ACP methyl ester carboxylesterase